MISFIKKRTAKILKCKPDLWSTRLLWVIFITFAIHLALSAIVLLTEWDVRFQTEYEIWISFLSIIILLVLTFYMIFLLRFNVFKRFGKLSPLHYVGTFFIYLFTIGLFVSWIYNPYLITSAVARTSYDDAQIAKDINRINVLINTLEYDSIPHLWTRRKVVLKDSIERETHYNDDYLDQHYEYENDIDELDIKDFPQYDTLIETTTILQFYNDGRISRLDSASYYDKLKSDSVIIIDDTSFYRFSCPNYTYLTFHHDFFDEEYGNEKELEREDLFELTIVKKTPIKDPDILDKELRHLIKKYSAKGAGYDHVLDQHYYLSNNDYQDSKTKTYSLPNEFHDYINDKYEIYDLDEGIQNISSRYYMLQSSRHLAIAFYFLYYLSLFPALLLFLFRHNRNKSFFLTALAAVLLFILTATLLAVTRSREETMLGTMIFYYLVFGIGALSIFRSKRYNLISAICNNLFIFFTPFILLFGTGLYYIIKRKNFNVAHSYEDPNYHKLYQQAFQYQDIVTFASQVVGFILFIVLLQFVFSKLLRKSYALPEN